MGDQHLVRKIARQENQQIACKRRDLALRTVSEVHAQLTTISRLPIWVEVDHRSDAAAVVIAKAIQMRLIEGARRIQGEMAFKLFQAEKQRLVHALSEPIHYLQIAVT